LARKSEANCGERMKAQLARKGRKPNEYGKFAKVDS
jgi:hypothetical protein